ncbi:MAG: hypothetical protein WD981_07430 [Gaiellaceae bacterium]
MTWSVPDEIVAVIDQAQPYHRGNAADRHPLAILGALSNFDKHRSIPITALVPDDNEAGIKRTAGLASWGQVYFHKGRAYEVGAVVAECKIVPDNSGSQPEMNVHIDSTFDVGFGQIPTAPVLAHKPVIRTLKEDIGVWIIDEVFNRATLLHNERVQRGQPTFPVYP